MTGNDIIQFDVLRLQICLRLRAISCQSILCRAWLRPRSRRGRADRSVSDFREDCAACPRMTIRRLLSRGPRRPQATDAIELLLLRSASPGLSVGEVATTGQGCQFAILIAQAKIPQTGRSSPSRGIIAPSKCSGLRLPVWQHRRFPDLIMTETTSSNQFDQPTQLSIAG